MWRLRRRHLVGLDIDGSAVRMVQLRKDSGGHVIVKTGVADIAPWGRDPHLHRIHTVRAITECLSSGGITGKLAICGLRGPEVVVRGFEFSALPPDEIEGAVALEVSQICPFLAEESTRDYQVTSQNGKSTTGFWVAATNGLIEDTRQIVSEAGLRCALIDVAGLALLNLLQHQWQLRIGVGSDASSVRTSGDSADVRVTSEIETRQSSRPAVLHVSDAGATIAIADLAGRPFVRDIGCGAPADRRRPLVAARVGGPGSVSVEDGWAGRRDCPSAAYDSLVEDVATTLRYYAAQNGSMRVDRLLVCGGGAAEQSTPLLRETLNLEVQRWNPLADAGWLPRIEIQDDRVDEGGAPEGNADHSPSPIPNAQCHGPTLAVAAGLALRCV